MSEVDYVAVIGSRLKILNFLLFLLYAAVGLGLPLALRNTSKDQRTVQQYRGALPVTTVKDQCTIDQIQELQNTGLKDPATIIIVIFALAAAGHLF